MSKDKPYYDFGAGLQHSDKHSDLPSEVYSFDRDVFTDSKGRFDSITKALGLDNEVFGYCICSINPDLDNGVFNLETAISLSLPYSESITCAIKFLQDMVEHPQAVLQNMADRTQFLNSVNKLKANNISLRAVFEIGEMFYKTYTFAEYAKYNSGNNVLELYSINESENNPNIREVKKDAKSLGSFTSALHYLESFGIIALDYNAILKLKEQHRQQLLYDAGHDADTSQKGLNALRLYIAHESQQRHSIASLSETSSVRDLVEIMSPEEIKMRFPFKTEFDKEFIMRLLQ